MSDLTARDTEQDGEPLVELTEEGRLVGYVYEDEGTLYAEFVPDEAGEPWAFEVDDLQRILDAARAILTPEEPEPVTAVSGDVHPVDALANEFDAQAVRRGEEDEGFYPMDVVGRMFARAAELDLAIVSLEGFEVFPEFLEPVPGLSVDMGDAHDGEPWPTFKAGCHVQGMAVLEKWASREGIAVALEVCDRDGDRFVL
ncbi:MAG TPA: hypothetical protein VK960_08375 [Acidimicrobiia bacterium]|nr:hypothetical protein [Acidimicrobiia bacterium]